MSSAATRPPRPASTICVVRDGRDGIEVVMCRRTPSARFMGGSWVFPGGAVDAVDGTDLAAAAVTGPTAANPPHDELAWMAAALRELAEETGIWLTTSGATTALPRVAVDDEVYQAVLTAGTRLDGASLSYFANWITPAVLPIRFDTRFYAGLVVDEGIEPDPDGEELDVAQWIAPSEALERARLGTWPVPFPTRKTLDFLASFSTAEALVAHAASIEVSAVEPKLRIGTDGVEIVLPGEPGFDDLPAVPDGAAEMLAQYRDEGEGAAPDSGSPS